MRCLFIGGTKRGFMALEALLKSGAEIAGVLSLEQDAHETERYEVPMRNLASTHHIPLKQTKWLKDWDYKTWLENEVRPDIAIVVGCRILLPQDLYRHPPLGSLGVHDSLLPQYRGFAPSNWAILNGERETGVTLFYLSERMDGGDVVMQRPVPIGPDDSAPEVFERVCQATIQVILEAYPLLAQGNAPRHPQDYRDGNFTCSRTPADGWIDWTQSTASLHNLVRALTHPYPGAFTAYRGRLLKIWRARALADPPRYIGRIPGRVVQVAAEEGSVDVLTGDGVLRLFEVQFEGEQRSRAADVITSVRGTLGASLPELLSRIERLEQDLARR